MVMRFVCEKITKECDVETFRKFRLYFCSIADQSEYNGAMQRCWHLLGVNKHQYPMCLRHLIVFLFKVMLVIHSE